MCVFWSWGNIFAYGVHAWALIGNHLHIVVHMCAATANAWSAEEVAMRWVRLYPAYHTELCAQKVANILENTELVAEYRTPPEPRHPILLWWNGIFPSRMCRNRIKGFPCFTTTVRHGRERIAHGLARTSAT